MENHVGSTAYPPYGDAQSFTTSMQNDYAQRQQDAVLPTASGQTGLAVPIQPARDPSTTSSHPTGLCAGLDYANMKKEEAREEFKEKRRRELLEQGEIDRVKRRKKNDTSMSDNQKYHRRLKMNQDSAAAARHAQDVYVQTLEELVATAEAEKLTLAMEAGTLRGERDELAVKLGELQREVAQAVNLEVADADGSAAKHSLGSRFELEPPACQGDVQDPSSSVVLLRKMMEIINSPDSTSAVQNDADFARGLFGIMPAPAV